MSITLSPDQEVALDIVTSSIMSGERVTLLAGAAGCGKTTVAEFIIDRLAEEGIPVIQAAPTGIAAWTLAKKTGRPAVTLHRIAYEFGFEGKDGILRFVRREEGSLDASQLMLSSDLDDKQMYEFKQLLRSLKRGDRLVVLLIDEASMVDIWLFEDLWQAITDNVLILAVGDHCQLFPVKGKAAFRLWEAKAKLEKVHRQKPGPLLSLVTAVRTEKRPMTAMLVDEYGLKLRRWRAPELAERLAWVHRQDLESVCLTGLNRTRLWLNRHVRDHLGYPHMREGAVVGESVIVLNNNRKVGCFNGQRGLVAKADEIMKIRSGYSLQWVTVDFRADQKRSFYIIPEVWAQTERTTAPGDCGKVKKEVRDQLKDGGHGEELKLVVSLAPGSAMTVHKSQGSQFPRGVVVMDTHWMGSNRWRGDYTAATRFEDDGENVPDVAFIPAGG